MAVGLARGGGNVAFGYDLIVLLAAEFANGYAKRNNVVDSAVAALVTRLAPSRRDYWDGICGRGRTWQASCWGTSSTSGPATSSR
jgi:hypothetical protein